jgi:hypothetical protein
MRVAGYALLSVLALGCYESQIASLTTRVSELERQQKQAGETLSKLGEEDHKLWSAINCKNEKLRAFIEECVRSLGRGPSCSEKSVATALTFMTEERHVMARLSPKQGIDSLSNFRQSQLKTMLAPEALGTSTRIIIVMLPVDDNAESHNRADNLGRGMRNFIIKEYALEETRFIPPMTVGCDKKRRLLKDYMAKNKMDKPDPDETRMLKGPHLVSWIFRVDC